MIILRHPHATSPSAPGFSNQARGEEPTAFNVSEGGLFSGSLGFANAHTRYTEGTNAWDSRTLVGSNRTHLAGAKFDGLGYQSGGASDVGDTFTGTDTHSEYDNVGDSWTARNALPTVAARHQAGSTNDKVCYLRYGGATSSTSGVNKWHRFSTSLTWTDVTIGAAAINWNGNGMNSLGEGARFMYSIVGQASSIVGYQRRLFRFDPDGPGQVELTAAPMPDRNSAAGFVSQGGDVDVEKANLIAGWNGSSDLDDNDEYDMGLDSWASRAAKTTPVRARAQIERAAGKIYCCGGYEDGISGTTSANEEYTPGTNSWATKTAMASAAHYGAPFAA